MKCDSLHVKLFIQKRLMALLPSLIAAGWSCIRHNDGPNIKLVDLFKLVGIGLSLVCCLGLTGGFLLLRYFSGIVVSPAK